MVHDDRQRREEGANAPRGRFRGRMDGSHPRSGTYVDALVRFLKDPHGALLPKVIFWLALGYVLLPIDMLPGGLIPIIGWFDDIIVALLAWTFIKQDVNRYRTR